MKTIEEVYGPDWRNIVMVTLAPELCDPGIINILHENKITVSLGMNPHSPQTHVQM